MLRGDLADLAAAREAVTGQDVVFHVAAKAGIWGTDADFHRSNVEGTRVLLAACREAGVGRFVFTSTPSVVHTGGDIAGGHESLPVRHALRLGVPAHEGRGRAAGPRRERPDPGHDGPATAPRVGSRRHPARAAHPRPGAGGAPALVGDGSAVIDTTYVDDAARAHLDAADALAAPGAACAGRPYFVTSGDPRPVRELVDGILAAGGMGPVRVTVPRPVAVAAGAAVETVWRGLGLASARGWIADPGEPPMTRFLARQLATEHWFDISAARRDLGYAPAGRPRRGVRAAGDLAGRLTEPQPPAGARTPATADNARETVDTHRLHERGGRDDRRAPGPQAMGGPSPAGRC